MAKSAEVTLGLAKFYGQTKDNERRVRVHVQLLVETKLAFFFVSAWFQMEWICLITGGQVMHGKS